jgi:hypothetical protein
VRVRLVESELCLGDMPIEKQATHVFTLRNMSRMSTVSRVEVPSFLKHVMSVTPVQLRIGPEERKEVEVRFKSSEALVLDARVTIFTRGGRTNHLRVFGQVIEPEIYLLEDEINFGQLTTLCNPGQRTTTVVNESEMPVVLELRLDRDSQTRDLSLVLEDHEQSPREYHAV